MGTEKNAEQRSIDEKKRLERERWERERREQERRELDEEWEAERSRAGDWERAKAAILAGKATPAIGQRADGAILIVTIDGRQPTSVGASYEDLIEIMMNYGAINAANLDGGSSTYMVQNEENANNPKIITQTASLYGPRRMATAKRS